MAGNSNDFPSTNMPGLTDEFDATWNTAVDFADPMDLPLVGDVSGIDFSADLDPNDAAFFDTESFNLEGNYGDFQFNDPNIIPGLTPKQPTPDVSPRQSPQRSPSQAGTNLAGMTVAPTAPMTRPSKPPVPDHLIDPALRAAEGAGMQQLVPNPGINAASYPVTDYWGPLPDSNLIQSIEGGQNQVADAYQQPHPYPNPYTVPLQSGPYPNPPPAGRHPGFYQSLPINDPGVADHLMHLMPWQYYHLPNSDKFLIEQYPPANQPVAMYGTHQVRYGQPPQQHFASPQAPIQPTRPPPKQTRGKRPAPQDEEDRDEPRPAKRRHLSHASESSATESKAIQQCRELGYTKPLQPIQRWGSRGQFSYHSSGELKCSKDRMSKEDMFEFIWGHESATHRKAPLTIWIGRFPFHASYRFANEKHYAKCRLGCCLDARGTVEKGTYVAMFDEHRGTDYDFDPFKMPRVHLWCLERHFDFIAMCQELDVRIEERETFGRGAGQLTKTDGDAAAARPGGGERSGQMQVAAGNEFIRQCKALGPGGKPSLPQQVKDLEGRDPAKLQRIRDVFGAYPHYSERGLAEYHDLLKECEEMPEHGPYVGTLGYRLAVPKAAKDVALHRHQETRMSGTDAKSKFLDHLNDLALQVHGRRQTRRLSQQVNRTGRVGRRRPSEIVLQGPARSRRADLANDPDITEIPSRDYHDSTGQRAGRRSKRQKKTQNYDDEYEDDADYMDPHHVDDLRAFTQG